MRCFESRCSFQKVNALKVENSKALTNYPVEIITLFSTGVIKMQ
jgi:hypothetical protein